MVVAPLVQSTLRVLAWSRQPAALLGGARALVLLPGLVLSAWAVGRWGPDRAFQARSRHRRERTPVSPRQERR